MTWGNNKLWRDDTRRDHVGDEEEEVRAKTCLEHDIKRWQSESDVLGRETKIGRR